jgi:lysophospholipase L1-like esterase
VIVACLGDSITAGSPLWDPDPSVRLRIESPDERSQWQWRAARRGEDLDFRNHGVCGQRTDEIAARLDDAARGADVLIVQGGINDVVQSRSIEQAARDLAGMVEHGLRLGLRVALADVLPWNNGDARAAHDIVRLNTLVSAIAVEASVPLLPFHDTLADPERPSRMRDDWTDDGNHRSIRVSLLASAFRLP